MGYNYKQVAEQIHQETMAHIVANPLPADHAFAMNPANQQFLNRANPHKQLSLIEKGSWRELFFGRKNYTLNRPEPSIFGRLLTAIFMLALALGAVYFIYYGYSTANELSRNGIAVQGTVVDKQATKDIVTSSSGRTRTDTDYRITYEFTVTPKDGQSQVIRKSESVSSTYYNSHKVGGPIEVVYSPTNPDKTFLTGTEDQMGTALLIAMFVAPISFLVALYNFWQFARKANRRRELKNGKILPGFIFSREVKNKRSGKPASVTIGYSFQTPYGQTINSLATFPAKYFKSRWHVSEEGKPVKVLYQNDNKYELM